MMKPVSGRLPQLWSLVCLKDGRAQERLSLPKPVCVVGRDPDCDLPFKDQSISRRHAELDFEDGPLRVRDLGSRNGLRVNGVPRSEAVLEHGDTLEIGSLSFLVAAGAGEVTALRPVDTDGNSALEPTRRHRMPLSPPGSKRSLATLYHVCAWLAEDLDENAFADKCLHLLLEAFDATEVHLYDPRQGLLKWLSEDAAGPDIKLVPYLVAQYSSVKGLAEASVIEGAVLRKNQPALADFNLLLAPLRRVQAADADAQFIVLFRPAGWNEFTKDDRVLLQTIAQIWVQALQRVRHMAALQSENDILKKHCVQPRLLGASKAMEALRKSALKAARTSITVSLLGETGSGKEVVAHFIHQQSPRHGGLFVKLNCAAVPEGLIESELFGHVRGAFTDARSSHRGKFEQAHGGTLFLDEIGEMPLTMQSKLLRAIELGEVEKVGSERPVTVDVRIIAASHRNLEEMVRRRTFREDLFYRLNVMALHVPPLREHKEDIGEIAAFLLTQFCAANGLVEMELTPKAIKRLEKHDWPGNVRELRNVIQRCAVHAEGAFVDEPLIKEHLRAAGNMTPFDS